MTYGSRQLVAVLLTASASALIGQGHALQARGQRAAGGTHGQGGAMADPFVIEVSASSKANSPRPVQEREPWLVEDFARYAGTPDLLADPGGLYSRGEDVGARHITLDPTDGVSGLGQSMRYTFPDRSQARNLCRDFTIGRNIRLPEEVQELWVEVWAKFSHGFSTKVPQCAGRSNAGYKFVHLRVRPSRSRFNLNVGNFMTQTTWGYPDREQAFQGSPKPSEYFDGKWHRWRLHVRVGRNGLATAYFDDRLIHAFVGVPIDRSSIYGIALGRNINQGPVRPQSVNWGLIKVWRQDPGWGW